MRFWGTSARGIALRGVLLVLAVAFWGMIPGCGGSNPPTVRVHGKILYQGQPVDRGTVNFHPLNVVGDEILFRPGSAYIQNDGTFKVATFQFDDGLQPGEYAVTIRAVEREPDDDEVFDPVWLIPERYGNPETSQLTATVPADSRGPVEILFELND